MCGICGTFDFRGGTPASPDVVGRMARSIRHRGPDDDGMYLSGSLGFGFRRLSFQDLSPLGHQPMADPSGRYWIIFNGEIYNFHELRAELEGLGATFKSHSDTEVILQGFVHWGDAILQRMNGMFGLAIWDNARRRLLVARDAMGIKPVYYIERNGVLYFGSELRAIFAGLDERPELDPTGVNLFLRYRYTPAPLTMFRGVRKLAPGERLVVDASGIAADRWYQHHPRPLDPAPSDDEAAARLLDLYQRAVKRHLISDAPLGLLLSGGMDSGLLLGLMSRLGSEWPTFTVGYGSSFKDDELDDAAATARTFKARHSTVQLDQAAFERILPRVVAVLEEPVASSSIVPMYFVSERARQDVKGVFIGQGPDELFGGYTRHLGVQYGGLFRALPGPLRSVVAGGVSLLPRNEAFKRAVESLSVDDRLRRYQSVFSLMPGGAIDALFRPGVLSADCGEAALTCWAPLRPQLEGLDELNGFQLLELRSSLPDELLMYGDKLSMIHSLEARVPYLDREVVEFAQSLPARFKVRGGQRKWLHRRVGGDFLPPEFLRRKKRGFAVNVVDDWFQSDLGSRITSYLEDEKSLMYGLLDPAAVKALRQDHASGRQDHHKVLFSLVVLEQWLRTTATGEGRIESARS